MIVVSDSSPLIALAAVRQLALLSSLYGDVIVPPTVWAEVTRAGRPGVAEILASNWIRVVPVSNLTLLNNVSAEVDAGEAEAITLAHELNADALLLDERRARRTATRLGIPLTGVLTVLVTAKSMGLVPTIKPILDDMALLVNFRLKSSLYDATLKAAGE